MPRLSSISSCPVHRVNDLVRRLRTNRHRSYTPHRRYILSIVYFLLSKFEPINSIIPTSSESLSTHDPRPTTHFVAFKKKPPTKPCNSCISKSNYFLNFLYFQIFANTPFLQSPVPSSNCHHRLYHWRLQLLQCNDLIQERSHNVRHIFSIESQGFRW